MALRAILEFPDPRLRQRAAPVASVDASVHQLLDDLLDTLRASGGIGLAATQIDDHRRVLVADLSGGTQPPLQLINPEVIARSIPARCEESCLSVPGVVEVVPRDAKLRVRALGRDGAPFELEAEGLLSACIQHEIDHLDGIVFVDRLSCLKRARVRRKLEKAASSAGRPAPR